MDCLAFNVVYVWILFVMVVWEIWRAHMGDNRRLGAGLDVGALIDRGSRESGTGVTLQWTFTQSPVHEMVMDPTHAPLKWP